MNILLASSDLSRIVADLLVAMPLAGLALYGWRHGAFLAVMAGLQVLGSFVGALACVPVLAASVETMECPPSQSLGVAYIIAFLTGLVVTRLAIGTFLPEGAMRFSPIIDHLAGTCFGAMAGFMLAGSLLVGWSLFVVPEPYRLEVSSLKLDAGTKMLVTFGRCVESNLERQAVLLGRDREATERGLLDCYREADWRTSKRRLPLQSGDGAGEDLGEVDGSGAGSGAD